jgi:hypothetical protein
MSSILPQEVHSALSRLLLALASADNVVRSQAEEQLNTDWVPNRRDVLLMGLAEQLQGAEDATVSFHFFLVIATMAAGGRNAGFSNVSLLLSI